MYGILKRVVVPVLLLVALLIQLVEPLTAKVASKPLAAPSTFEDRKMEVLHFVSCDPVFEERYQSRLAADQPETGENEIYHIIAKVALVNSGKGCIPDDPAHPAGCDAGLTRACLTDEINGLLKKLKADKQIGTEVEDPPGCHAHGEGLSGGIGG
jgi:hypothetical protein